MRLVHSFVVAALLSAAWLPGMAAAADAPPAVQAFLANIERQTAVKPAYEAINTDGSGNVTITNLTVAKPASANAPGITMKVGEIQFSGITEESPALYRVGKASFNNMMVDTMGNGLAFTVSIPQSGGEGWYIRALGDNPTPAEQLLATSSFAHKMNAGKMSFTAAGQTFSVDGLDGTWDGDPKTGAGTFNLKVRNIAVPEAVLTTLDPAGVLRQLGYSSLNLDITSVGDARIEGDKVGYSFRLGIAGRGMASISMGAALSDIPLAVYTAMLTAPSEGKEPDLTSFKRQIQNIALNGASLRFEDASIVNKVLKMAAAMQGTDENTLRASIGPMVQLALVQMQNEAFTKQVTDAVTAFMAAPKSLTLTARPGSAVTFSDLSAMDPNKPGDAINRLGLTVTAND